MLDVIKCLVEQDQEFKYWLEQRASLKAVSFHKLTGSIFLLVSIFKKETKYIVFIEGAKTREIEENEIINYLKQTSSDFQDDLMYVYMLKQSY
jgi:hypothetical protein